MKQYQKNDFNSKIGAKREVEREKKEAWDSLIDWIEEEIVIALLGTK